MSTAQILALGAIAGLTIFIGLPIGRMHGLDAWLKCFLSSTATGILLFLLWDVLSGAVEPVEDALTAGRDGRFAWLATFIATGIGLHNFSEGLAIGQSAASDELSLALVLAIGFGLHNATEGFGIVAPLATEPEVPSWGFLALLGVIGGAPTFFGTLLGQAWVNESVSVAFLALAGGSILYVVLELLNVSRAFGTKQAATLGILLGLVLGFGTDFILVAAGA